MAEAEHDNSIPTLVDAFSVPEFFCEALHSVEQVGPCRRLLFTIHQREGDRRIAIGVAKLVLPADVLADVAKMLAADVQTPSRLASFRATALAN